MRTWTLVLSVCAHAVAIGAIVVAPIFATTDLPEPHRAITFETITPIEIPPARVPVRQQPTQPVPDPSRAPVVEPNEVVAEVLPPTNYSSEIPVDPGATGVGIPSSDMVIGGDPAPLPTPPPGQSAPLIRVGGDVRPPKRIVYVQPKYPAVAMGARIDGTVILEAVIGEDGSVREVRVLRSIQLLDRAAVEAVAQWKFTPTLLNGTAVPVVMTVTVGFSLTK